MLVICLCIDVVVGMVVVVVVGYCGVKGCYFIALRVQYMVYAVPWWQLNWWGCSDDCDDGMVLVVMVG